MRVRWPRCVAVVNIYILFSTWSVFLLCCILYSKLHLTSSFVWICVHLFLLHENELVEKEEKHVKKKDRSSVYEAFSSHNAIVLPKPSENAKINKIHYSPCMRNYTVYHYICNIQLDLRETQILRMEFTLCIFRLRLIIHVIPTYTMYEILIWISNIVRCWFIGQISNPCNELEKNHKNLSKSIYLIEFFSTFLIESFNF